MDRGKFTVGGGEGGQLSVASLIRFGAWQFIKSFVEYGLISNIDEESCSRLGT